MTRHQRLAGLGADLAFKGRQFTGEVILWAVRWYLMFPISYRVCFGVEEGFIRTIGDGGERAALSTCIGRSSGVQHALPEQVELGAAEHLPLNY